MTKSGGTTWIGLLEVKPTTSASPLAGRAGAFVHAVVYAWNELEYIEIVEAALSSMDIELVSASDIEELHQRRSTGNVASEIEELALKVNESNAVEFDEFQAFGH